MFCVFAASAPQVLASDTIGNAADIGQGNAVYFGRYPQHYLGMSPPSTGESDQDWISALSTNYDTTVTCWYSIDPIEWRVLQTTNDSSFLLSKKNLDVKKHLADYGSVTWETSMIRAWLNGYSAGEAGNSAANPEPDSFIVRAFNPREENGIIETSLTNDNPITGISGGNSTTDRLFLLSIEDINTTEYGFTANPDRVALNTGYTERVDSMNGEGSADQWWLRSPGQYLSNVAYVLSNGVVSSAGALADNSYTAVRPAFKLNLSSVFFTSAAEGGKSDISGSLADNNPPVNTADLKLTILDPSQTLEITATKEQSAQSVSLPGDLDFSYANVKTGTNQYVSCVLEDNSGAITHYGKLADSSDTPAGDLSIPLPALLDGTYILKVFAEQANADYLTDFAGNPTTMTLTVSASGSDTTAAVSNFSGTVDDGDTDPSTDPGTDPDTDSDTDPGTDPDADPGTDPDTDTPNPKFETDTSSDTPVIVVTLPKSSVTSSGNVVSGSGGIVYEVAAKDALTENIITHAVEEAKKAGTEATVEIRIDESSMPNAGAVTVNIPIGDAKNAAQSDVENVKVTTAIGEVTLNTAALNDLIDKAGPGDEVTVGIAIEHKDASGADLPEAQKEALDDEKVREVYDVSVVVDGDKLKEFKTTGKLTIGLPYALKDAEVPEGILIVYVSPEGTTSYMTEGRRYDTAKSEAFFITNHLSVYAVTYEPLSESGDGGCNAGTSTVMLLPAAFCAMFILRKRAI
ncbi:MAG: DUF6273 domain-containing protein [Synergistaceae bacterium]|nr:DUF6273 domain-containing protein [Synergistaceae bacterium]